MLSFGIIILFAILLLATLTDLFKRRIPNWLVGIGLFCGLGCSLFSVTSVSPTLAILGSLTGLAIMLPGYLIGSMGAGDAKLMAMIGAFLGPHGVFVAALLTFVLGGFMAIGWHPLRARFVSSESKSSNTGKKTSRLHSVLGTILTHPGLPYAPAITLGTATFLSIPNLHAF